MTPLPLISYNSHGYTHFSLPPCGGRGGAVHVVIVNVCMYKSVYIFACTLAPAVCTRVVIEDIMTLCIQVVTGGMWCRPVAGRPFPNAGGLLHQSMLGEGSRREQLGRPAQQPPSLAYGWAPEGMEVVFTREPQCLSTDTTYAPPTAVRVSFELEGKVQEVPGQAFSHLAQRQQRGV